MQNKRDHFVAGQISIRSPKDRNGLNMLKTYQKFQSSRLAAPKRGSVADLEAMAMFDRAAIENGPETLESPRGNMYLRKTLGQTFSPRGAGAGGSLLSPRQGSG